MTKLKSSKVTIKATKFDTDGKKTTATKTFSKNNKTFRKDVEESKKLLDATSDYSYTASAEAKIENDSKIQKQKDINEYKALMKSTENIECNYFLDASYNWHLFVSRSYDFIKGLGNLAKAGYYSIRYIISSIF